MLDFIRNRAQGWIAWVIVILIIIPFALFGLDRFLGGGKEPPVAKVNENEISKQQLENAYYQQRQRLQQMFGGELPANLFSEAAMKQQITQRLIEEALIVEQANDARMRIGLSQLAQQIHAISAFQTNGQFDPELYKRLLATQNLTPASFEGQMARDLLLQQYRSSISDSEFVTPEEAKRYAALQNQQRDIGYLLLKPERYHSQITLTDEAVAAEYNAHLDRYREPERVSISYIELQQKVIAGTISVTEEQIQNAYDTQLANYRTPEERSAAHILITVENDAAEEQAKKRIDELYQQLQQGANFAELAQKQSQDPGSAAQGGELGFFGRGVMDDAFEQAAFELKPGALSPPVRSQFGYHIIRLNEVRGGGTKTFAEVKEQIRQEIQQQEAEQIFYDKADKLANLSYEHPNTLQIAAEELKLPIQHSKSFSRQSGGEGVTAEAKVRNAAFVEDVRLNGNNSEVIELAKDHLVVLRVDEHIPEGQKPLEAVREAVKSTLQQQQAVALAQAEAAEILKQLQQGSDRATLMSNKKLEWQQKSGVLRSDKELDAALVQAIFNLPHPTAQQLQWTILALNGGVQAVVVLEKVTTIEPNEEAIKSASTTLLRGAGDQSLNAVLSYLRQQANITLTQ